MKVRKPASTSLWPVPTVLVSCGLERPNIITLAWVGTLCSDPPSLGIGVRPERFSFDLIQQVGEFVVHLPRADQVAVVDYCGQVSGRDVDKWAKCNLTPVAASKVRVPLIDECPIALECRVSHQLSIGVHDLFVGEILAVQVDQALLTEQGKVDYERAQLMTYVGGYYHGLSGRLGRFGDWRRAFD